MARSKSFPHLSVNPVHWKKPKWLPRLLAAAAQESDPGSTLHFTRSLTALRRSWRALREGEAVVRETPEGVLGFERRLGDERLLCLFDLGGAGARLPVESGAQLVASFNGGTAPSAGLAQLPAWGGVVLGLAGRVG